MRREWIMVGSALVVVLVGGVYVIRTQVPFFRDRENIKVDMPLPPPAPSATAQ